VYFLDYFLFVIKDNKIRECYYAIEYFKKNPQEILL